MVWQWNDPPNYWHSYDMDVACILEEAYSKGIKTIDLQTTACCLPYIIDLQGWTQMRVQTGYRRNIMRCPLSLNNRYPPTTDKPGTVQSAMTGIGHHGVNTATNFTTSLGPGSRLPAGAFGRTSGASAFMTMPSGAPTDPLSFSTASAVARGTPFGVTTFMSLPPVPSASRTITTSSNSTFSSVSVLQPSVLDLSTTGYGTSCAASTATTVSIPTWPPGRSAATTLTRSSTDDQRDYIPSKVRKKSFVNVQSKRQGKGRSLKSTASLPASLPGAAPSSAGPSTTGTFRY